MTPAGRWTGGSSEDGRLGQLYQQGAEAQAARFGAGLGPGAPGPAGGTTGPAPGGGHRETPEPAGGTTGPAPGGGDPVPLHAAAPDGGPARAWTPAARPGGRA